MKPTMEFNGKVFDYAKFVKTFSAGIKATFKPDAICLKTTEENVIFIDCENVEKSDEVVFYIYRGTNVILNGIEAVKKAVREGTTVTGRLFTKHTLQKSEVITFIPPEPVDDNRYSDTAYRDHSFGRPSNRPSSNREARPTSNYNRSGGSNFPKTTSRYSGGGNDYDGNTGYPKGYRR